MFAGKAIVYLSGALMGFLTNGKLLALPTNIRLKVYDSDSQAFYGINYNSKKLYYEHLLWFSYCNPVSDIVKKAKT